MEYFVIIFSTTLALTALFLMWKKDKSQVCAADNNADNNKKEETGICEVSNKRATVKENKKQKILEFLKSKNKAGNKELRDLVGVVDRTVVRYMNELEKSGQVKQVGKVGRQSYYKLK